MDNPVDNGDDDNDNDDNDEHSNLIDTFCKLTVKK